MNWVGCALYLIKNGRRWICFDKGLWILVTQKPSVWIFQAHLGIVWQCGTNQCCFAGFTRANRGYDGVFIELVMDFWLDVTWDHAIFCNLHVPSSTLIKLH